MTLDHLGYAFILSRNPNLSEAGEVFRILGRLAFPLFMFMLAEGMRHSKHRERYILRILAMYLLITIGESIVIAIPYFQKQGISASSLDGHPFTDILLNGAMLYSLYCKRYKKLFALIPFSLILFSHIVTMREGLSGTYQAYFPLYLRSGYGLVGPALSIGFSLGLQGFRYFYNKNKLDLKPALYQFLGNLSAVITASLIYLILGIICIHVASGFGFGKRFFAWENYCLFSMLLILLYNGTRGYDSKPWRVFSYFYFLIHMGIILIIMQFI